MKRSASKFFRKIYAYPREAKDLNLLLNKRKHAKITQKMDKDKKQFKSFFEKGIICHVKHKWVFTNIKKLFSFQ